MTTPKYFLDNPAYSLHGFEPRDGLVGRVMLRLDLPNIPPIPVQLTFTRQEAEKFLEAWRKCLDVAKGLNIDGTPK